MKRKVRETRRESWTSQIYMRPVHKGGDVCVYAPYAGCFVSKRFKDEDVVRVTVELLERKRKAGTK